MRTVLFSCYYLPPPPGSGQRAKPYQSSWKMSPDEAKARGLTDADIVPGSSEPRPVPETEGERDRAQVNYQSAGRDSVKPPRR